MHKYWFVKKFWLLKNIYHYQNWKLVTDFDAKNFLLEDVVLKFDIRIFPIKFTFWLNFSHGL